MPQENGPQNPSRQEAQAREMLEAPEYGGAKTEPLFGSEYFGERTGLSRFKASRRLSAIKTGMKKKHPEIPEIKGKKVEGNPRELFYTQAEISLLEVYHYDLRSRWGHRTKTTKNR